MLTFVVEFVGWVGALLILGGYGLVTAGRVDARSRSYQWMNVAGAAGLIVNGTANGALPSVFLNVVWLGIGAAALWRLRPVR
jgi:hypothetical protein